MSTDEKNTSHDSGRIAYVYQMEGHKLRFDPCHHQPADLLGGFINRFCDGISAGKVPTTIQSSLLLTGLRRCYATSRCKYRLMYPGFPTRSLATETQSSPPSPGPPGTTFELDCGYHLCVFYESIYESHKRTFSAGLWRSKSLSAGLVGLRAWIWPSSGRFSI